MMDAHKKRPITYSGCWTCKARKIKCDETPGGCKACVRKGLACEGYGIKLRWMSSNEESFSTVDHARVGRRRVGGGRNAIHHFNLAEVDTFLMNIENDLYNGVVPSSQGPFTTFLALCNNKEPASGASSSISGFCNHIPYDNEPLMTTHDLGEYNSELSDETAHPSALIPYTTPRSASRLWSQPQAHICDNPETNLLFNHYSLYVANVLQPLSHTGNPYRSLYVPAALEGSMNVVCPAKHVAPSVRLSIFHSLVATAAFHMSSCNPALRSYHETGILHRQKALRCMQLALAEGASQSSYRHLMVALCSLLTIGVMEGSIIDFQFHIQAMLELRKSRQHWKIMSSETARLNEMSSFMMLIANSTSCYPPLLPDFPHYREEQCRPPSQTWCYEFTYGVTTDIARAIEDTIQLYKVLLFYDKLVPRQEVPEDILEACESLGDKLLSWSLHEDLASAIFPDDGIMQVIFYHHAHAWHLGTLIYYLQYIQGSTRADITKQVAMIASNLHTVEDLKSGIPDNQMAPITWPAFVASCSALDRETWVAWWTRMQRYGIGTMKRQFNVVKEVWSALDADPDATWLEIIRRRRIEVLAL